MIGSLVKHPHRGFGIILAHRTRSYGQGWGEDEISTVRWLENGNITEGLTRRLIFVKTDRAKTKTSD
jgi:hypothetical protein